MINETIYNNKEIMDKFNERYGDYYITIDMEGHKYNFTSYKNGAIVHDLLCDNIKLVHFKETKLIHVCLYKIGYDSFTTYERHIETFYVLQENINTKCYVEKTIYTNW